MGEIYNLYSRNVHLVARVIKSQDKKPSLATICKSALLCTLHDHDMFRPS
jgi:hypothetical protein